MTVRIFGKLRTFLSYLTCHPLSWLGSLATTMGVVFAAVYFWVDLTHTSENPYLGAIFLTVVPPLFFGGLVLIPLGIYFRAKKIKKTQATDTPLSTVIFNMGDLRQLTPTIGIFLILSVFNGIIALGIALSGYHYMDSSTFCGRVCHTVMKPEYTAYQRSPHARIDCVDCHIGEGAEWFVRSKLSGTRQLWNVARGTYQRPIPVPIEHLRPARETCEQCHWPEKFHGGKLKLIPHFAEDKENTKLYTVLILNVGGAGEGLGGSGIHWHVTRGNQVKYVSEKGERQRILSITLERKGEEPMVYKYVNMENPKEVFERKHERLMDCVDCHNRPTHIYEIPEEALDQAMVTNPKFQNIPWFKKTGLRILKTSHTREEIDSKIIKKNLLAWYRDRPEHGVSVSDEVLESAGDELQNIYARNIWPEMNITWGTYPSHLSHIHSPGCFRCHDNNHRTSEGVPINADCRICHAIFAIKEKNPPILKRLRGKQMDKAEFLLKR